MNIREAKEEVKGRTREILDMMLEPAKRSKGNNPQYVCPICGHGAHGDGLKFVPNSNVGLKCFGGGCRFDKGDVIKLYQCWQGCDFVTAVKELAISLDSGKYGRKEPFPQGKVSQGAKPQAKAKPADYSGYYMECALRYKGSPAEEYMRKRGISEGTARRYGIGYDPAYHGGAARAIIPCTSGHYLARALGDEKPKYLLPAGGGTALFNADALSKAYTVFVAEGTLDALSIIECGHIAVGLNGAKNVGLFVNAVKAVVCGKRRELCLLVALDKDAAGESAGKQLLEGLKALECDGVKAYACDICLEGCKDENESMCKDRAAFERKLDYAEEMDYNRPNSVLDYIRGGKIAEDMKRQAEPIATGFERVDENLGGGFYPGLYVIGAASTLGKTTFCHQIADQVATAGREVLYFTLEQSVLELVSKSLSREYWERQRQEQGDRLRLFQDAAKVPNALTIRRGQLEQEVFDEIAETYMRKVGNRISVIPCDFGVNVDRIREYVTGYIERTGARPLVIVDYLQILPPPDMDANKSVQIREVVNHNVTALRVLARDNALPVIAISAINRGNYNAQMDYESFKESGLIEYSCDGVIGLQYAVAEDNVFLAEKDEKLKRKILRDAKHEVPRKIELTALKNRNGAAAFEIQFLYNPVKDLFVEKLTNETPTAEETLLAGKQRRSEY